MGLPPYFLEQLVETLHCVFVCFSCSNETKMVLFWIRYFTNICNFPENIDLTLLFNFLLSPREISNTVNSFLISSKLKQRRKCKMLWWVRKFRAFSFKKRRPHLLTHISPMFHFYTPWKCQKTFDFLIFSGGAEVEHWAELG